MQGVLESRTKQVSAIWGDRCFLCAGWPYALASAALATVFALWLVSFPSSLRASLCLLSSFHLAFLFLHKGRQGRPLLTKAELESDVNDYSMPECSVPAHCPRVWLLTWRASRPPPPPAAPFPRGRWLSSGAPLLPPPRPHLSRRLAESTEFLKNNQETHCR